MPLAFWPLANVATFGINTYLTFSIGASRGSGGFAKKLLCPDGKDNSEISARYPTLVTPAGWAFSIWGLIFLGEGASVVWQCFAPAEVQISLEPAAPYICSAFVLQGAWTVAFAQDKLGASTGLIFAISGCMAAAYALLQSARELHEEARTYGLEPTTSTTSSSFADSYSLHLGWLAMASLVNVNMWLTKADVSSSVLRGAATGTKWVAALGTMAATVAFRDPTFAFVSSWALKAISSFDATKSGARFGPEGVKAASEFTAKISDDARDRQASLASRLSVLAAVAGVSVLGYRFAQQYTWAS